MNPHRLINFTLVNTPAAQHYHRLLDLLTMVEDDQARVAVLSRLAGLHIERICRLEERITALEAQRSV